MHLVHSLIVGKSWKVGIGSVVFLYCSSTLTLNLHLILINTQEREGPPMPDKPRPAPLISGNRYMMCTHHSNGKRCLYGADCKFAHSQNELDLWNATIVSITTDLYILLVFSIIIM